MWIRFFTSKIFHKNLVGSSRNIFYLEFYETQLDSKRKLMTIEGNRKNDIGIYLQRSTSGMPIKIALPAKKEKVSLKLGIVN